MSTRKDEQALWRAKQALAEAKKLRSEHDELANKLRRAIPQAEQLEYHIARPRDPGQAALPD